MVVITVATTADIAAATAGTKPATSPDYTGAN
jgi:hypothetical protein